MALQLPSNLTLHVYEYRHYDPRLNEHKTDKVIVPVVERERVVVQWDVSSLPSTRDRLFLRAPERVQKTRLVGLGFGLDVQSGNIIVASEIDYILSDLPTVYYLTRPSYIVSFSEAKMVVSAYIIVDNQVCGLRRKASHICTTSTSHSEETRDQTIQQPTRQRRGPKITPKTRRNPDH